jgi:hypothetical protein
MQVRACGSALALQLGPLLSALGEIIVDVSLMVKVKGDSSINMSQRQPLEIPRIL